MFDFREAWRQTQAFGLAIGVHVIAALFVVMGTLEWTPFKHEQPVGLLIEAVIVDTSQLAGATRRGASGSHSRRVT